MRSARLSAAALFIALGLFGSALAQRGNSVSGMVFGVNNRPVYDAYVELMDQLGRVIAYTRTNGSGRYSFDGNVPRGKFSVRVRTLEPDYEEMTQEDTTVNFTRTNMDGSTDTGAVDYKVMDFRLKVRKEFAGVTGVVFAQDVPAPAKKLFESGVKQLAEKKQKEGLADLRGAIEAYPTYFAALEMLATEYEKMKQYQAAASLFDAATKVNPRSYRSWYGLALSFKALNYVDESQKAINKALEIFAGGHDTNLLAGYIAYAKKEYTAAEKYLKKAKEVSEDKVADINWQLALTYSKLEKWADAARELKSYLKNYPDAPNTVQVKGLITDFEAKAAKKTE